MRIALVALLLCGLAAAGELKLKTARGDFLAGNLHTPKAPNGAAVVIAPGQGYHKDLPVLVVSGDKDPLCQLKAMYGLAAKAKRPVEIVVVPGDHSLRDAGKDEAKTKENIDLAARALVVWAKRRIDG
ncbi:MAG: hypothetical protein ACYTGN_07820 [Planctomycetota bacterium]|jgi:fermentation-respiration switch protein FrsA (DUF1100 family)